MALLLNQNMNQTYFTNDNWTIYLFNFDRVCGELYLIVKDKHKNSYEITFGLETTFNDIKYIIQEKMGEANQNIMFRMNGRYPSLYDRVFDWVPEIFLI